MRVPTVLESNRRNHALFGLAQRHGGRWGRKRGVVMEGLEDRRLLSSVYRTYDGTGNNLAHPLWGSAGVDLLRLSPADYANGIDTPAGAKRPGARVISNAVMANPDAEPLSDRFLSAMIYTFGQFLDHDLDLTPNATPTEPFNIPVPANDPVFPPGSVIPLNRSVWDPTTGTSRRNPRQQINVITGYLDGSQIYGSDEARADALRAYVGGRMLTSDGTTNGVGNLLPLNTMGLPNANDTGVFPDNQLFVAGDVRSNENVELTALQTLFLREHNRVADQIHAQKPWLNDEQIYQQARQWVIAELQAITYNEFIPALLGKDALPAYRGYDPKVNPGIANEFSAMALRSGHSQQGNDVEFINNDGEEVRDPLPIDEAFTRPDVIKAEGIDTIVKYLASDVAQEMDTRLVDGIRNGLFAASGVNLDLGAIDIQRGRDHGLADYNSMRLAYGLPKAKTFDEITSDPLVQQQLKSLYGNVNNIDAFVGALAEDHVPGSSTGSLLRSIFIDQFQRTRDGDRYWYERTYSGQELKELKSTTLADIIRRNTTISNVQENVFFFKTSISGQVFWDKKANGRNDFEDPGLGGWTVFIDANNNGLFDPTETSTVTKADGYYTFDGVGLGTFRVREVVKPGWAQTTANPADITITRGIAIKNVDFGNRKISGVSTAASNSVLSSQVGKIFGAGDGGVLS